MKRLEGKNVLITGGSTGIGRSTAIRFADEGANVAINYHASETEAEITLGEAQGACSLIRERGCKGMLVQGDVANEEDVKRIFDEVLKAWGRIDVLINNAGIQAASPTHEMSMDAYDRVLAVNLRGAFLCSREAIRHFLDRGGGGVILNNTSVHETMPKPQYAPYAASKAGLGVSGRLLHSSMPDRVSGSTRSLRARLEPRSTVNGRKTRRRKPSSRGIFHSAAPGSRRRSPRSSPSLHRMKPLTSPGRRSTLTAG